MTINTKDFQVKGTFGIDVQEHIKIQGRADNSVFVPAVEEYAFRKEDISLIGAWMRMGGHDGLYLTGPTGSGKTSLIKQFCARLNIPLQQVTAYDRLETPELIGHQTVINGDLMFQDGPLTTAMRHGHWFLLNEADLLDPGTAAGLNDILEGQPLTIPENGGEVVHPAEGFAFIATGNTNGGGDADGLYVGTTQQNLAFMDRFMLMQVDYMDETTERDILAKKVPEIPEDIRNTMVETANQIRKLFMGESNEQNAIEVTMSTRTLIRWAKLAYLSAPKANDGIDPIRYSLGPALGLRASETTREALEQMVQRMFGGS